jgi:hypothetical protein
MGAVPAHQLQHMLMLMHPSRLLQVLLLLLQRPSRRAHQAPTPQAELLLLHTHPYSCW